jgi:hypothetical protein
MSIVVAEKASRASLVGLSVETPPGASRDAPGGPRDLLCLHGMGAKVMGLASAAAKPSTSADTDFSITDESLSPAVSFFPSFTMDYCTLAIFHYER